MKRKMRTKRSKMLISKSFENLLKDPGVQQIVVLPHTFPDGDTLGSAIGILELLKAYKKEGYIILNDDIPSNLMFLFEEIDLPLKSEEIHFEHIDLAVAVDCGESKLLGDRISFFERAKHTVVIDHHKTNSNFGQMNIVAPTVSSTGEMIADLFHALDVSFSKVAAQALYAAIVTDTGSFRYSNTTPATFEVCQRLVRCGFDFNKLNVELFQNKPLEKLTLLHAVFGTLSLYHENKCAVVRLTEEMIEGLNLMAYDTDGIVEFVRDIAGVEVVVFIRYIGNKSFKISMRSKNDFDVSAVAMKFHGGGHTKAAGFKNDLLTIEEIERQVVLAIKEAI